MAEHPSLFELDVLHASTAAERAGEHAALEAHLNACADCRAYVDTLSRDEGMPAAFAELLGSRAQSMSASPSSSNQAPAAPEVAPLSTNADTAPHSASDVAPSSAYAAGPASAAPPSLDVARQKRSRRIFTGGSSVVAALALAAGIALFVRDRRVISPTIPDDESSYVGIKGVPAAQALIRRDGKTRLWDGASRLRPGDALAVGLACEQFTRAAVYARGPVGPSKLWEGECPRGANPTLPFTLVVDGEPGRERFSVILSRTPLDDERSARALQASTRGADVWTIDFTFEKETR